MVDGIRKIPVCLVISLRERFFILWECECEFFYVHFIPFYCMAVRETHSLYMRCTCSLFCRVGFVIFVSKSDFQWYNAAVADSSTSKQHIQLQSKPDDVQTIIRLNWSCSHTLQYNFDSHFSSWFNSQAFSPFSFFLSFSSSLFLSYSILIFLLLILSWFGLVVPYSTYSIVMCKRWNRRIIMNENTEWEVDRR